MANMIYGYTLKIDCLLDSNWRTVSWSSSTTSGYDISILPETCGRASANRSEEGWFVVCSGNVVTLLDTSPSQNASWECLGSYLIEGKQVDVNNVTYVRISPGAYCFKILLFQLQVMVDLRCASK